MPTIISAGISRVKQHMIPYVICSENVWNELIIQFYFSKDYRATLVRMVKNISDELLTFEFTNCDGVSSFYLIRLHLHSAEVGIDTQLLLFFFLYTLAIVSAARTFSIHKSGHKFYSCEQVDTWYLEKQNIKHVQLFLFPSWPFSLLYPPSSVKSQLSCLFVQRLSYLMMNYMALNQFASHISYVWSSEIVNSTKTH